MAVQISGNDITVPRDGTFTRNVTIGGTLTYEDVTNIDSVGLITARTGIEIGARPGVAASISVDGNMIVSGISTFGGAISATSGTFTGGIDVTSNVTISDSIVHSGDDNTKIRFPSADTITAETAGTERLRITSDGLVGVNVTPTSHNDTTALQIHDTYNSQGYPRLRLTNSASGSDSASGFEITLDGNNLSAIVRQRENAGVHVYTNNLERLRVGSNGNVEIGSAAGTGLSYSLLDGLVVNAANGRAGLMVNSSSSDHNAYVSFAYGSSAGEQFNAYLGRVGISTLTFGTNNTIRGGFLDDGALSVGTLEKSGTSNVLCNINGNKMIRLSSFYIGYVPGTSNNSSGVMILHKMGQNVGMQFSGMATIHSYTGSAYLRGCITVRYNTDNVTSSMTTSDGQSGANFQLVSGTISGESGTWFGIKKNGGGTGSFYINAFVAGNIESYGGIREISNSNWTTATVHGSGIG